MKSSIKDLLMTIISLGVIGVLIVAGLYIYSKQRGQDNLADQLLESAENRMNAGLRSSEEIALDLDVKKFELDIENARLDFLKNEQQVEKSTLNQGPDIRHSQMEKITDQYMNKLNSISSALPNVFQDMDSQQASQYQNRINTLKAEAHQVLAEETQQKTATENSLSSKLGYTETASQIQEQQKIVNIAETEVNYLKNELIEAVSQGSQGNQTNQNISSTPSPTPSARLFLDDLIEAGLYDTSGQPELIEGTNLMR